MWTVLCSAVRRVRALPYKFLMTVLNQRESYLDWHKANFSADTPWLMSLMCLGWVWNKILSIRSDYCNKTKYVHFVNFCKQNIITEFSAPAQNLLSTFSIKRLHSYLNCPHKTGVIPAPKCRAEKAHMKYGSQMYNVYMLIWDLGMCEDYLSLSRSCHLED
jgi:hypothetical protein